MCLERPVVFGALRSLQKKLGRDQFPLIPQTMYTRYLRVCMSVILGIIHCMCMWVKLFVCRVCTYMFMERPVVFRAHAQPAEPRSGIFVCGMCVILWMYTYNSTQACYMWLMFVSCLCWHYYIVVQKAEFSALFSSLLLYNSHRDMLITPSYPLVAKVGHAHAGYGKMKFTSGDDFADFRGLGTSII